MDHQAKINFQVNKIFEEAVVKSVSKFAGGLVGEAYQVEIENPDKILVVKFFPLKSQDNAVKSMKISNYLSENGLPSPHTYNVISDEAEGITIMDCAPGKSANGVWESLQKSEKEVVLKSIGSLLRKIHALLVPEFWIHRKHEIASAEEWVAWTKLRVEKYLAFAKENLGEEIYLFLSQKFERLLYLYELHKDFDLSPLHWDYHLGNINIGEKFDVTGVFDFDNAMKGHNVADLGQTMYWLVVRTPNLDTSMFENFLEGYGDLGNVEREFVYLHFLLFLSATTRTVWPKEHLRWLSEIHLKTLGNCVRGEYLIGGSDEILR